MGIAAYITTIGMAKSIAKSVLENKLSVADEKWRKTDLSDYKQSSKSSTIHMNNLRGLTELCPSIK
jgi:precorrin-6B methylase 1